MEVETLLHRHAKHFVQDRKLENFRPELQGIHYHEDGSIYITDSHKALAFYDAHSDSQKTVHFKSGELIDGKYPNVVRLFQNQFEHRLTINLASIKPYLPLFEMVGKKIGIKATISIKERRASLNMIQDDVRFAFYIGEVDQADFNISFNLIYFKQILAFLSDTGAEEVEVRFTTPMRPISFIALNYEAILMPIRRL